MTTTQNNLFSAREFTVKPVYQAGALYIRDEQTSEYRTAQPKEIVEAAASAIDALFPRGTAIKAIADSKEFFKVKMAHLESERFSCLFLNNKHEVLAYEELFFGTIDSASVYPREVVKRALANNASAVIFAHNHPSGSPEPSRADEAITAKLKDALALIDVKALDHIVVGAYGVVSLADRGIL